MFELISTVHAAETAMETASKSGGIGALGINLKLFLAQLVNFAIVFFILWKLVFKNIIKTLGERQKKIEDSLANAKKVEENLARSEADYKEKIAAARAEAHALIKSAEERALQAGIKIKEKTKEELAAALISAKETIQSERETMMQETKHAIAELIVQTAEKLLREKLTESKDKQLIEKIISKTNHEI